MRDYEAFLVDLRAADLIVKVGPLGCRIDDTPMNTDAERTQQYFSVMNFRDRTHWMSLMRYRSLCAARHRNPPQDVSQPDQRRLLVLGRHRLLKGKNMTKTANILRLDLNCSDGLDE